MRKSPNRKQHNPPKSATTTEPSIKEDATTKSAHNKKINLSLIIAVFALLVSVIQLIITSPFFLDSYYKPIITVTEGDNIVFNNDLDIINTNYTIENSSSKTANDLELAIEISDVEMVGMSPKNSFKLYDSSITLQSKIYYFKKNKIVPDEIIYIVVGNTYDYLKQLGIKEPKFYWSYNIQEFVPRIISLKSDVGFATLIRPEKFVLKPYELRGKAIPIDGTPPVVGKR